MKKNSLIKRIINSNITLLVVSVLLSVIIWAIVKINFSDETVRTISSVPVNIDASLAAENSMFPFYDEDDLKVDVQISGRSYDINSRSFSAGDISVEANGGYVDSSGYKVLTLSASSSNPDVTVVGVNPSNITIYFDRKETRTFDVEAIVTNDNDEIVESGYTLGKPAASVPTAEVEGPASVLANLNKVLFSATLSSSALPLTETTEFSADVSFDMKPKRGEEYLKLTGVEDGSIVPTVTIPVSTLKTVSTSVNFINQPPSFAENPIDYEIDPQTIDVSFNSSADIVESIVIGTIDFSKLDNKLNIFHFDVESSTGYSFADSKEKFEVKIDMSNMSQVKLEGIPSNVVLTGQDSSKTYVISKNQNSLKNIVIIGPKSSLNKITADDIQVEVNVESVKDAKTNKIKASKLSIASADDCWAYGDYYVNIEAS